MKVYVLTVSKNFPATHPRKGESTGFVEAIGKLFLPGSPVTKIHTIRANYDFWKKRIDNVNAGNAILSIRYWTGKPYNSDQREILSLTKAGIQQVKLNFKTLVSTVDGNAFNQNIDQIGDNDGLQFDDFRDWFKGYDLSKPMAIIHFTNFRY